MTGAVQQAKTSQRERPLPDLVGERVMLRPVCETDLTALRAWYNDVDTFPYMSRQTPLSEADQANWYASVCDGTDAVVFAVTDRLTGLLLGSITLRNLDDPAGRGELGILLGRPGSGYGADAIRALLSYAFVTLRLNTVSLEVRGDNRRAITAYMRAGFRPEGVLRRRMLKAGTLHDLYSMSIIREEFLEEVSHEGGASPRHTI
jgi:RimJ/RimL family protein N-acetyltransferase